MSLGDLNLSIDMEFSYEEVSVMITALSLYNRTTPNNLVAKSLQEDFNDMVGKYRAVIEHVSSVSNGSPVTVKSVEDEVKKGQGRNS